MKIHILIPIACLTLFHISSQGAQLSMDYEDDVIATYVEEFKQIAIEEMIEMGIPSSIKLAQGILESNAGRSFLAIHGNNHFGMKCGSAWKGRTVMREDDDYHNGKLIKSCFRAYASAQLSYKAHSQFLRDPNKHYRYGPLFELDPMDYEAWAHGLKKAGYATASDYAERLISLIERYSLFQFDQMSLVEGSAKVEKPSSREVETPILVDETSVVEELPSREKDGKPDVESSFFIREARSYVVRENNHTTYISSAAGDDLATIALETGLDLKDLIEYNDYGYSPDEELPEGSYIYTSTKRSKYKGKRKTVRASAGETAFDIAQKFGVRLDKLYKRNRWSDQHRLKPGEEIWLRGKKKK